MGVAVGLAMNPATGAVAGISATVAILVINSIKSSGSSFDYRLLSYD